MTEPPTVTKQHRITAPHGDSSRLIGHVGPCPERGSLAFAVARNSHDQRVRTFKADEGGVYAITRPALEEVVAMGASHILVVETDTGDVYEWPTGEFTGSTLPADYTDRPDNPQGYATRDSAEHVWEDHAPDGVFRGEGDGFERASERGDSE